MARKRMLDPMTWDDPDLANITPTERLLFIGLVSLADDYGHISANPIQLRKWVFGYDSFSVDDVRTMRDHILTACRNLRLYVVDGQEYIWLKKWEKHQDLRYRAKAQYPCHACGQLHEAKDWGTCKDAAIPAQYLPGSLTQDCVSTTQELRKNSGPDHVTLDHVESDQIKIDTPSGNGSRRPQPVRETPKQPNAVYAIFAGYCRGLGIEPKMIPKKQQAGYLSVAAGLLEAEYTPAEVEQCTRALKGQNWWQDKPLHLRNVAEAIPQWKQNGLQPSKEAKNVPANLRPPSDASKRVVRALTPDEFNRRYPGRPAGVSDVQGVGMASDAGPPSGPS